MVIDTIQKAHHNTHHHRQTEAHKRESSASALLGSSQMDIGQDKEKEIKDNLQKEIAKLLYQKNAENITAVKEVSAKETVRIRHKDKNKDKSGLTSIHHMAAEATVRQMKFFLALKRGEISEYNSEIDHEEEEKVPSSLHTDPSLGQEATARNSV